MGFLDLFTTKQPQFQGLELKKAFDAARYGMAGVPAYPNTDRQSLMQWEARNEVVYACIRKKCEAAADPEIVVEKNNGNEWESVDGHPLVSLLEKPNPDDTFDTFLAAWIASEETTGDFYAEIVRTNGVPTALYPLDPSCMFAVPNAKGGISHYEFRSGYSPIIRLDVKDVLHRRKPDLSTRYYGLSPLRVAIGSVDADQSQTDFVRAFFHSDGIPAGLLKVLNRSMNQQESEALQQRWMTNYRRGGDKHKQIAVLDQNAEFQIIGSNIGEIEGATTRGLAETRICMVFGVPAALIGAYVGLDLSTNNATMRTHMEDFWMNTMSPMLKSMRVWLTWNLLSEFEPLDKIKQKKIRVNWDMTQVMAMQEDEDARHDRARKNFAAGGWSINEFREATGLEPLDGEDYFLQPNNTDPMTEAIRLLLAEREPPEPPDPNAEPVEAVDGEIVPPKQIGDGKVWSRLDISTLPSRAGVQTSVCKELRNGQLGDPEDPYDSTIGAAKSYDYNGLTLCREPNAIEKSLDLKGISESFDSEKAKISSILISVRNSLIEDAVSESKNFDAVSIHQLVLTPPVQANKKLTKAIENAVEVGRKQVQIELGNGKSIMLDLETKDKGPIKTFIDRLVDVLISRTVNEIQTRVANLFATLGTLGLSEDEITAKLKDQLDGQSLKVFESFASQTANAAINAGREAEMKERSEDIVKYQYSAILDANTCPTCSDADGMEADNMDDLPPAPNEDCSGGANCRCFIIGIGNEENA